MAKKDCLNESRDPIGATDYIGLQHIERYRFACEKLPKGSRVLDIACGTGYGTMMLRRSGMDVVGADVDGEQVASNRRRWSYEDFITADARDLPFPSGLFDAIVSFETIEHVPNAAPYMSEICRVLKKKGAFICSTPKKSYSNHPPYHLKEYMPREFFSVLDQYFADVGRFGQYFQARDRFTDLLRKKPRNVARCAVETLGIKEYLKRCVAYISGRTSEPGVAERKDINTIPEQRNSNSTSYYRVRQYDGATLLRIMVAMAKNKLG